MKKIIVAIDGYSSCGKSTMAKMLAQKIGYTYIDTGAMYRTIALYALRNNLIDKDSINQEELKEQLQNIHIDFQTNADGKTETFLNDENVENEIRKMHIAQYSSRVSELKFVREALVAKQRAIGKNKGIVMDGRDIGTVVFPEAELKIFLTAKPEIRAQRRYDELKAKGENVNFDDILTSTIERDNRDINRKESPLRKADDALVFDNSKMSIQEQKAWLENVFNQKLKQQ